MNTQKAVETKKVSENGVENNNVKTPVGKMVELPKMIEKFKPEPITVDERISRVEMLKSLGNRYKLLKEKQTQLGMFKAGNDKTTAQIVFTNQQGFEFEIRNTNVIDKLCKEAEKELDILINEAQNEILVFEI